MSSKKKISQEDLDAFHRAVQGTKPIKQDKIRLSPPTPRKKKPRDIDPDDDSLELNEAKELPTVGPDHFISYKQAAISHKTLRNLRKGQYNVDAILDLHGMTIERARNEVDLFLRTCLREKLQVVLIIHGKGHHRDAPVLKNKLNHWLRELNIVLAFCSATSAHGSRGAIYVLLKRSTREIST